MKTQDIRTLKILEEIENNKAPSQRDLAGKLNVSLGLMNAFIKRLAQKGYFKVTTIPRNRVKYMLTPKGATEKARLTYEYVQYSFQFYKTARKKTTEVFNSLVARGVLRVAFCGAGELAEIAYVSLQETSIRLVFVIDDEFNKNRFLGVPVLNMSQIFSLDCDMFIITDVGDPEIWVQALKKKGVATNRICVVNVI